MKSAKRAYRPSAATFLLVAALASCSGEASPLGPVAIIDGTWRILRTAGTDPQCNLFFDPAPPSLEITFRGRDGVLESVPASSLAGFYEPDGTFELHDVFESVGAYRETVTIRGKFEGDDLTATESHVIIYFDPVLITVLGSDPCTTTYGWAGERA